MVVSKGQVVRDEEDVELSARILDDISKNLERKDSGQKNNKTRKNKDKVRFLFSYQHMNDFLLLFYWHAFCKIV